MRSLSRAATRLQKTCLATSSRQYATGEATLRERFEAIVPQEQARWLAIKKAHGDKSLGDVKVEQAIGGARGVKCMIWETSLLDAEEGIRFRGYTIPELQELLPDVKGTNTADNEPLPEGILWLLLTGEIPSHNQVAWLRDESHSRAELPSHVVPMLRSLPKH